MWKSIAAIAPLLVTGPSWADCPPLKDIIPRIEEIRQKLLTKALIPMTFGKTAYLVQYGETGRAVDDLLAGNYRGYMIHRVQETPGGVCEYILTDDRTPATGSFVLKPHERIKD